MVFFFISIVFMYIGRKIGWAISKGFLYSASTGTVIVVSALWGFAVALSMFWLIRWQAPNIILKIIMGYALGCYVAIPNFGLLSEGTISNEARPKHTLISILPSIVYILAMVVLSLTILE
jgi:hypothetical protein